MLTRKYIDCNCCSIDHLMRMTYFTDVTANEPDLVYVEVSLVKLPWWKRIWYAIRYVFGYQSKYGAFDEFIWTREETTQVRDFCNKYLELTEG